MLEFYKDIIQIKQKKITKVVVLFFIEDQLKINLSHS